MSSKRWLSFVFLAAIAGCGEDAKDSDPAERPDAGAEDPDAGEGEGPETYEFESRFERGKSSVSYGGQTLRLALIKGLASFLEGLSEKIDAKELTPAAGDVKQALLSFYEFDSEANGTDPLPYETSLPLVQKSFDDLATGKFLKEKFAGNGGETEYKDFSAQFVGATGQKSAEGLLLSWFDEVDALAVSRAAGEYAVDKDTPVYVTADGRDLKELIEKLLFMGVAYSQITDKYLDDASLTSTNVRAADDTSVYTPLEHAWDEGFGYFGASRDYGKRKDGDVAQEPAFDTNADGKIDLTSEYSFPFAVYAVRRDGDSKVATKFSEETFEALLEGRALIAAAGDELTEDEKTALLAFRDAAVLGLDRIAAANVVHYINTTLRDLGEAGTAEYSLSDVAEHFAEAKAFALGLQFNPKSTLSGKGFATLHDKLGDAPVLPDDTASNKSEVDAYKARLLEAREIVRKAYGFAVENVGDDAGNGGW